MKSAINRSRKTYVIIMLITIVLGLLSRSKLSMPDFISTYAGDTLWALTVFLMFCVILSKQKTWVLFLCAIVFAYSIEFLQLYQAPWIESIRNTIPGKLILGFDFVFSDFICYTIGILFGALADIVIIKKYNMSSNEQ